MPKSSGNKLIHAVASHLHLSKDVKQEKKMATPLKPKLPYNPYGLNSITPKKNHNAFSDDVAHPISLPALSEEPNKFLPKAFQEESNSFEAKYNNIQEDYIGNGGSAMIRRVVSKDHDSKRVYALKKFALFKSESVDVYYRRTASEFIITRSMNHLHTVKVLELVNLQFEIPRSWGMIMFNYPCDFYKVIRSPKWKYTPVDEKLCCFKQVCLGLKYIHEQDICHLDLKPDNILVSSHGVLKITDFGCAVIGHEDYGNFNSPVRQYQKLLGTPPYQAPEVTIYSNVRKSERKSYCPFKFDYFSLGILLFVFISGKTPFLDAVETDVNFKQFKIDYNNYADKHPTFLENDMKTIPLINSSDFANSYGYVTDWVRLWWRLCDPNPTNRMTLRDIFHDEWFQQLEICIDESDYECNFVCHEKGVPPLDFTVKYGEEYDNEKVHRHGSNIRSRSNTINRNKSMLLANSFSKTNLNKRYSSVFTTEIPQMTATPKNKSDSSSRKSRSCSSSSSSSSCSTRSLSIEARHGYVTSKASNDREPARLSAIETLVDAKTPTDSQLSVKDTGEFVNNSMISLTKSKLTKHQDEEVSDIDAALSLKSLRLCPANMSANEVVDADSGPENISEKFVHFGDDKPQFYYPNGEVMHYTFSEESYNNKEKFMVINNVDVWKSIQNIESHDHSSIYEVF